MLILVDKNDKLLGYAPKSECHTGNGKHHRAILVVLYNSKKEILLQKRKHNVSDNVWDLTAASHPLHFQNKNETYSEASTRCIKWEWSVSGIKFRKVGAFNYFKQYGLKCENEYCVVIVGKCDSAVKLNHNVAYGYRWAPLSRIAKEVKEKPESYSIWARLALSFLKKKNF